MPESIQFEQWSVAYDVRGESQSAIVFVHGANVDRRHWRHQMEQLSTGRRLIAVDLLGHGESSVPPAGYSVDLWARSIAAVLDHLGGERAVLIGHSNGVPVIRQFYRLYPRRVQGLIAVDGALWPPYTPQLAAWFRATLNAPDYPQKAAAFAEQTPQGRLPDADFAYLKSMTASAPREAGLGWLEAFQDESVWATDPIEAPLLYIASGWTAPGFVEKVRALAPQAEIEHFQDCGHFVNLEDPARFNRVVEGFVSRL